MLREEDRKQFVLFAVLYPFTDAMSADSVMGVRMLEWQGDGMDVDRALSNALVPGENSNKPLGVERVERDRARKPQVPRQFSGHFLCEVSPGRAIIPTSLSISVTALAAHTLCLLPPGRVLYCAPSLQCRELHKHWPN